MNYEERARRNDESRNRAGHFREPWTCGEVEFLEEEWDGTEETLEVIAEILGRTIEACRQKFYFREKVSHVDVRTVRITRTSRTSVVEFTSRCWVYGQCQGCGACDDLLVENGIRLCEDCQ